MEVGHAIHADTCCALDEIRSFLIIHYAGTYSGLPSLCVKRKLANAKLAGATSSSTVPVILVLFQFARLAPHQHGMMTQNNSLLNCPPPPTPDHMMTPRCTT